MKTGGRGARAGAEIGGNARSPGQNVSRGTPDAVHLTSLPRGAPHSPPLFTLRKHSFGSLVMAARQFHGGGRGRSGPGRRQAAPQADPSGREEELKGWCAGGAGGGGAHAGDPPGGAGPGG